jgi:hypothetical protein
MATTGEAAFRADHLIPRLRAASEQVDSFSVWKHVEAALAGTSDADCSVDAQDLELATAIVTARRPNEGSYGVVTCDHVHGVRILFLYFEYEPGIFVPVEIDLKYLPSTRFGLPWAAPGDLAACSVLTPSGVRHLAPLASDLVELLNYGTTSKASAAAAAARVASRPLAAQDAIDPSVMLPSRLRRGSFLARVAQDLAERDPVRLEACARALRRRLTLASGLRPHLALRGLIRRIRGEHAPACAVARLVFSGEKLSNRTAEDVQHLATTDEVTWLGS